MRLPCPYLLCRSPCRPCHGLSRRPCHHPCRQDFCPVTPCAAMHRSPQRFARRHGTGRGQPEVGRAQHENSREKRCERERQRKRAEATAPACRHDSPFSVRLVSWMRRVTTPAGRRVCGKGKTRAAAESQLDWTRVRSRRRKGRGRRAHARLRWTEGRRVACVCLEGERLCAGVPS